jgi:guanine deaminase
VTNDQLIFGPLLLPRAYGKVDFIQDGALAWNEHGKLTYVGSAERAPQSLDFDELSRVASSRKSDGVILPPFLDNHIHIPQHPIRGQFMKDVPPAPQGGRLLAGLNTNVFPAEGRCSSTQIAQQVVEDFLHDTLAKGVVGGAAYMTVHTEAARIALRTLPQTWHVGLVMMNMNCPDYLRTDEAHFERDVRSLAEEFGRRFILTDRFAVAVDSPLRQRAVKLAKELGLRMQTHLNEQQREKAFVETKLYPGRTYTGVYEDDGLLDCDPILAHCIHMSMGEFQCVSWHPGACVAHCPTSNTLLGSGVMPLDRLYENGIDYAICTDVGASPTTSMLCEMAQFLKVHATRNKHATPREALYRATLGPARMLGVADTVGALEVGEPATFIEVDAGVLPREASVDDAVCALIGASQRELDDFANRPACRRSLDALIARGLDIGPELDCLAEEIDRTQHHLDDKVQRVIVAGKVQYDRHSARLSS